MALKSILTVTLVVLFLPAVLSAQAGVAGDLTVRSNPDGALVKLKGELSVSGVTPVRFRQPLAGGYRVTIEKHGYERYTGYIDLDPTRQMTFDAVLSRKTRLKAAMRSCVIPGWGQIYGGQKTKGVGFIALALGSATAFLIAEDDFNNKEDDYYEAVTAYDQATTIEDRQRLWTEMAEAQREAYDAEDVRRILIGTTVAVWGLSVLDALLFFPRREFHSHRQGTDRAPGS